MSLAPRIDRLEKNYLINGAMDFWQSLPASAPSLGSTAYKGTDRWRVGVNNPLSGTLSKSTSVPTYQFTYSLQKNLTVTATSNNGLLQQRIESVFASELAGKTISVSIWVYSTIACDVAFQMATPDSVDTFSSGTQFIYTATTAVPASTWTKVVYEGISVPATAINGLDVILRYNNFASTGSCTMNFTGAMLNVGSKASDFNRAGTTIAGEEILCKRYYEKSYALNTAPGTVTSVGSRFLWAAGSFSNTQVFTERYSVSKRSAATVTIYNHATGASNSFRNVSSGSDFTAGAAFSENYGFITNLGPAATVTAGQLAVWHWTADAEL